MQSPSRSTAAVQKQKRKPWWCSTPAGSHLWDSRVSSLEALKAMIPEYSVLAIDLSAHTWRHEHKPVDVALGFMPQLISEKSDSLEAFYASRQPTVCCFDVAEQKEKHRKQSRYHEQQIYGSQVTVAAAELEETLFRFVEDLKQSAGRPLLLVGYCLHLDLHVLAWSFPSLASHIDGWLDVQDIVCDLESTETIQLDKYNKVTAPSQLDALCAVGLCDRNNHRNPKHHSANDVVRTLGLLSSLTTQAAAETKLSIPRTWHRNKEENIKLAERRRSRPVRSGKPYPPEEHTGVFDCTNCKKSYYIEVPSMEQVLALIKEFDGYEWAGRALTVRDYSLQTIGAKVEAAKIKKVEDRQARRDDVDIARVDALEGFGQLFLEDS